jgi:pyrimidine-specific ribonucleoside hydrolase
MRKIPVILDGDPGHDDAIAWLLACQASQFDIKAAIAVSGNVSLDKTLYNTLRVLTLLGRTDIPVAAGANCSLNGLVMTAPNIHGVSGLDGPKLPEPAQKPVSQSGVELMAQILNESQEPVTIIASGPLTDVAILLMSHPELKNKIERISFMGGGILSGNWTPAAEFNILIDPEAAYTVMHAGIPLVMLPLDTTEKAYVTPADFGRIKDVGNPVSLIVAEWLQFFYKFHQTLGYPGAPLHDPCAVGYLLNPEIFVTKDMYVDVERGGKYTRGATIGDYYNKSKKTPNATVSLNLNRQAFVDMIVQACRSYGGKQHV